MAIFPVRPKNNIFPIYANGIYDPYVDVTPSWPTAGAPTTGQIPTKHLIALVNYYVVRIISQYSQGPNAQRLIALMSKQALADDILTQILYAFDIDSAVGVQLDIIGQYVGVSRNINPATSIPYWGFENYSNTGNTIGFRNYAQNSNTTGVWETYHSAGLPNSALNDDQYRLVIQLQIILNSNDGTLASIQNYLNTLLPGFVSLTDNQDMTLTYYVSNLYTTLSTEILQQFLPKPMGVGINIVILSYGSKRVLSDGNTRTTSIGDTRYTSLGT